MQLSTCGVRSPSSSAGGTRSGMLACRTLFLARVIRWPTAVSVCSSARAISATVNPDTNRSVSASCDCRSSAGMRAGEHHPQLVIANRMRVGVIGACPDIVHDSRQFLSGTDGFAAQPVPGTVACDGHQPSAGTVGQTVAGPGAQRLGAGFLDGVLRDGEVAGPPRERGDGGAPFPAEDAVQVGHSRDATAPRHQPVAAPRTVEAGIIDASLTASSRSAALEQVEAVGDFGAFHVRPVGDEDLAVAHPHGRRGGRSDAVPAPPRM